MAPVFLDGGAFFEEVVEVERDEEEADEVAEGTGCALERGADEGDGAGRDFVAVASEPLGEAGVGEACFGFAGGGGGGGAGALSGDWE